MLTIFNILTFETLRHYAAVLEANLAIPRRDTYAIAVAGVTLFAIIFA